MSAEHNNLQPSTAEAITTEVPGENSSDQNSDHAAAPQLATGSANSSASTGAATAVVRAPESVEAPPLNNALPEESSSTQRDGSEPSLDAAAESAPIVDHSETSGASAPAIASESTETAEAESSETMDQLLDQFAVPEPAIAEGEI